MLGADGGEDDPLLGRVLMGRYRLIRVLGEGGMGKVYLAEHKLGNALRHVAVKALRAELSRDRQLVARFHRECETVVQLHHPNTVQFYDFGEIEGPVLFIVMEYIEGQDLAERLGRGPLPLPVIDKILIQICGSLHEAHQNGIVHRDLKPDNILLTERGGQADFVKVLDFGIAKNNHTDDTARTQLTMQGMILGTPPYMSPEQFGSEPLDARSDIYSLGLITYEMITGRLPFEARTPWEWATRHLTEAPRDIAAEQLGRALPPARREAVMRSLEKRPELRQASTMEFLREFTGIGDTQTAWAVATSGPFEAVSMASTAAYTPVPEVSPDDDLESPIVLPKRGLRGALFAAMAAALFGAVAAFYWLADPSMADVGLAPDPSSSLRLPSPALPPDAFAAMLPEPPGDADALELPAPDELAPEAPAPDDAPAREPAAEIAEVDEAPAAAEKKRRRRPSPAKPEPPPSSSPSAPASTPPSAPAPSGPSPAELARAEALVVEARAAIGQQDLSRAATKLQAARTLASGSHPEVRAATQELATLGGRVAGNLLMRGRCEEAQALYRALRAASAHGPAGSNFAGEWCPKP